MAGTLGSRLLGVVRQLVINAFPTALTDAFAVASRVPNLFRELLAEGALVNSFIPVYKSLDAEERAQLARSFTGVLIAINVVLLGLGIWAAPWIVSVLISTDGGNVDYDTAVYITRLVMPFLSLISLSSIAMGLLNADEHFKETSLAPIAFNLASIALLLLAPHTATWLGIGWTVGGLAQLLVQLPALMRHRLMPRPSLRWHPQLGRVLLLMAPFALTTSSRQFLNVVVTRFLSSGAFPAGTQTGYLNAEVLFQMGLGLFAVSPALALYPRLATFGAAKDWDGFRQLTVQALRMIAFVAAPVSALLVALAPFAMSVFNIGSGYDPGKFSAGTQILTTWALGIVPWGINAFLVRTFYVRERTLEPVIISAVSFLLEVGLYALLTRPEVLGLYGFGVSSLIMGVLTNVVLLGLYHRQVGFPLRELLVQLVRVLPAAALAGLAAAQLVRLLPAPGTLLPGLLGFAVAGAAGMALYLALAFVLRVRELKSLLSRVRRAA
ncbi:putative peptidoglycan lipid II flippase [Deinobacterium chartae]|uniref:Putative peptidoglycan lipid II flippase n=2 Tax=Deinobacterium chartae TaxID=521158 RepID=A0A841I3H6_9DEIO|nr:putative peptidoglycan lipid II flippase [Deinobacterium chartae]